MIGIVMAGGKGSRMSLTGEKLLLKYKKPVILHVIDALRDSDCFSKILGITSSNSPQTKKFLEENRIELFNTTGDGYVNDLNLVLKSLNDFVLITSADLPFLDGDIIKKIITQCDLEHIWTTIIITKKFLDSLHLSSDYWFEFENQLCCYSGISLVNAKKILTMENISEKFIIIDDKRIAFNLNTKQDYDLLGTA
ncbi:MAG: NTP transferase domain-containing protein [Nitrosarchaeum sp.]|jgi:adenosylcobinamide-phosphate guanylyltransferase|uniref:NTP transferase domain-containing protein n=1 Tax=Nitrosarchaeum sp. TaxID=2026886 RepID=UPI002DE84201|nr:NTP transferase domain-containing protein [Nitrosarchaeum sp.]